MYTTDFLTTLLTEVEVDVVQILRDLDTDLAAAGDPALIAERDAAWRTRAELGALGIECRAVTVGVLLAELGLRIDREEDRAAAHVRAARALLDLSGNLCLPDRAWVLSLCAVQRRAAAAALAEVRRAGREQGRLIESAA